MQLTVVIPAYNEAKRIGDAISSVITYFEKRGYGYEILVVDDGSTEDTATVAQRAGAPVHVLTFPHNCGKGAAVCHGMTKGCGDYPLYLDADGSTGIDAWDSVAQAFEHRTIFPTNCRSAREVD